MTTAQPVFDGLSEITAFGNATRITIVDETPTDPTFGQVIGGFDPSNVAGTNIAANWTDAFGKFSIPVNAGVFTSNGLKTVELYATDDAGSVGNKVIRSTTSNIPTTWCPPPGVERPRFTRVLHSHAQPPGDQSQYDRRAVPGSGTVVTEFNPPLITTSDASGHFSLPSRT